MKGKNTLRKVLNFVRNNDRIDALENKLVSVSNKVEEIDFLISSLDQISDVAWLYKNRLERMDASFKAPFFNTNRQEFHLERYRFAANFVKDKVVADIASGTGYGSSLLNTTGSPKFIYSVDISADGIEYARKYYDDPNIEFICASADETGIKSESVDIVVSFETIEHVVDDTKLLEEFFRILRPGGVLICSTPNNWQLKNSEFHLRDYTRDSFQQALSEKFEVSKLYNQNPPNVISGLNDFKKPGIYDTTEENEAFAEVLIAVCHKREE